MHVKNRVLVVIQWVTLGIAVRAACGLGSAGFLARATHFRIEHEWLVYTLPLAGIVLGLSVRALGTAIKGGNNLVLDTVHDKGREIPFRMAPMVVGGTIR